LTESTHGGLGLGHAVHRGPTVARTEGTGAQWRAHRSMASGHSRAQKLAGGGTTERGTRGTWLGPHRVSGDGEVAGRWRETAAAVGALLGGSCELGSEQRRAGVSVVMVGGAPHPFIVAGVGHARARKGETADDNDLNAIEGGAA
jgi:hypothetical protein